MWGGVTSRGVKGRAVPKQGAPVPEGGGPDRSRRTRLGRRQERRHGGTRGRRGGPRRRN
jgi:hypothetical protein